MRLLLASLLWCAMALQALAQDAPPPAVLVADDIEITPERVLIARGNVEAFQGQTRLQARQISYDPNTGRLSISGPITIKEGDSITILASAAELDRDLQNGLLQGARLVLDQQLQLAAVEMARVGGRFTQLYRTAVTSCTICDGDPRPPLWQIRARRVIHDQDERQLYFDRAQLRIRNVPVFFFPRLRLPDPTLDRATGFLIPEIQTTSNLGTGIIVPYFIKLGDHRDLTLAPYVSSVTTTLGFRYRQAFARGRIEFNGAVTRDDLLPDQTRGYLFGEGRFELNNDYVLRFDLEITSDEAYLREYNITDIDRLDSAVSVERARRDEFISLSFTNFRTLRDFEDNSTLPTNVLRAVYERRFFPKVIGGEVRFNSVAQAHFRESDFPLDGPDPDLIVDGRDVLRLSVDTNWRRSWFFGGLETQVLMGVAGDTFRIAQDDTFPDEEARIVPEAALTLRYPLSRTTEGGARQVLEPVVQVAWSDSDGFDVPNEESTLVEFDEGNLLGLTRFPAPDRREDGLRAAIGVNWAHFDAGKRAIRLSFGQIMRRDAEPEFTVSSGLQGITSDFLMAGQIKLDSGLALTARTLFDDRLDFSRGELRGGWQTERMNLIGSYVFLDEDPGEDRPDTVSEFNVDGAFRINNTWTAEANMRFDLNEGRPVTTGLGLNYTNECVRVSFSVDRNFTSTTSVEPQTSLGLSVSLRGFSASPGTQRHTRACGNHAS